MLARIRSILVAGCALAGLGLAAGPGQAQMDSESRYYPYYNYNSRGAPVPEQTLPDRSALRDWYYRVPPRYQSYYVSPYNPPTHMTSINYPLVYGAYIYPFPMGNYTYGVGPSRFSNAPTLYGDYYTTSYYGGSLVTGPSATLSTVVPRNTAAINVRVAADATVRFNDVRTLQRGENRRFSVPDLIPETTYSYDVSAEWSENGRQITKHREVNFKAGDDVTVDFLNQPPEKVGGAVLRTGPLP